MDEHEGGRCGALTRDDALAHPFVGTFWNVVDLLVLEDPSVAAYIAGEVSPGDIDDRPRGVSV